MLHKPEWFARWMTPRTGLCRFVVAYLAALTHCGRGEHVGKWDAALLQQDVCDPVSAVFARPLVQGRDGARQRNVIERAMIVAKGPKLRIELPGKPAAPSMSRQTLEEVERDHILRVLEMTSWRVRGKNGAAEILGVKPTTLESRMAKLGVQRRGGNRTK